MKATAVGAGVKDVTAVDEHDLAGIVGNDGDGERVYLGTGKRLRKELGGSDTRQDASVSVIVHLNDLCRARQNDADVFGGYALGKDRIFFVKGFHLCPKATQHPQQVFFLNIAKKGAFFQNFQIFFQNFLLFVEKSTDILTILYYNNIRKSRR